MADRENSGRAPSRNDADHTSEHDSSVDLSGDKGETAQTIIDLADQLNRGWKWFFAAGAANRTDTAPDNTGRPYFETRYDLSRQIADIPPQNLHEALIQAAAFVDILDGLGQTIDNAAKAFSHVLAHAQAEGVTLHPMTTAYFLPVRREPAAIVTGRTEK